MNIQPKNLKRAQLLAFASVCVLSAVQFGLIVTRVNPDTASSAQIALAAVSFWLLASCITAMLIQLAKAIRIPRGFLAKHWYGSLRQGTLAAAVLTLIGVFRFTGIYSVWDSIPLAIAALLLEFFFRAEKKPLATLLHHDYRS